jgi:hypothetical protein
MPNPTTSHAVHDELLIVRLFGDDVDDRERTAALDQIAGCDDCAALFADLGSIKSAAAALPSPARPRDFSLTEADAARLRPARYGLGRILGLGARRSFGGAMAALGLSGLLLTGVLSSLPNAGVTASALDAGSKAAPAAGGSNDYSNIAVASAATVMGGGTAATERSQFGPATAAPTTGDGRLPAETARAASSSPVAAAAPAATTGPTSLANPPASQDHSGPPAGVDARAIALAVSGLAFALGLLLLVVPPLLRRRASR